MLKTLVKGCEPTKGSEFSAGIDLYSSEDVAIGAGETKIIGLGVCIDNNLLRKTIFKKLPAEISYYPIEKQDKIFNEFLTSHYLELHPRSSLRAKGLISNTGIIDLDYSDEIKIIIHNPINAVYQDFKDNFKNFELLETHNYSGANKEVKYSIKKGDKIAQILLKEHQGYLFGVVSDEERVGGFGSTGK